MSGNHNGILSRLFGDHGEWKDGLLTREDTLARIGKLASDMELACKLGMVILVFGLLVTAYLSFAVTVPGLDGAVSKVLMDGEAFAGVVIANGETGVSLELVSEDGETILSGLLMLIVWMIADWRAARFFHGIVETGRPFELDRARDLKRIASALMRWSAVLFFVNLAFERVLLAIVPGGEAVGFGVAPNLPFAPYVAGGLLLAIARIWEYGCILQEQDDALL